MRRFVSAGLMVAGLAMTGIGPAAAQVSSAPRELGMGGAYMGIARGFESVYIAPANLGLPEAPRWSVALVNVAFGGALRGPGFGDFLDMLDFDDVSEARQRELLATIPADGGRIDYSLRVPLATISNRGFGFGVAFVSTGSHTISQDLAELLLEGYEDGRTDYAVGNTAGERAAYWDYAASYGRSVGPVSLGVTGHYIRGRTLVRTRMFEPRVDLEAQDVEVDYIGTLVRGGTGFGVDFGAAYMPTPAITISGAVTNAFATMSWSEDIKVRTVVLDRELIDNGRPRQLRNIYHASEADLDPGSASLHTLETARDLYDEAFAPAVARAGVAWNPRSRTTLAADYHQILTDGRLGEQWDRRLSLGAEQGLGLFQVRGGVALGDEGSNLLGGGLSIGPLDLGVARYQRKEGDIRVRGWVGTFGASVDQTF